MNDSERLNWLEDQIIANGEVILHDGNHAVVGFNLSLQRGRLEHTLREAIDTKARYERPTAGNTESVPHEAVRP